MIDKIKEKINRELADIENRDDLTKEQKVEQVCRIFATFCAAMAVQPIPFADFFVLTPIQIYMGKKIADIHGYPIEMDRMKDIVKEISATVGMGLLAQQLAIGAYKTFIPFLGAVTTIPMVFGLTYGMGKVMDYYFEKKRKGEKISKDELKNIFKNSKNRGTEMGKEKENEIKTKAKD